MAVFSLERGDIALNDCIFCKIVGGEIPAKIVYEDEYVVAFDDIEPQAPVHIVVIPKQHISNILEAREADDIQLARLLRAVADIAEQTGLSKTGFRIISNCGEDARQSVFHLHIHMLGGKKLPARMV